MKLETLGILAKPKKEDICAVVPRLLEWCAARGLRLLYDPETAACLGRSDGQPREQIAAQADLLVVLGGDGTLLAAARLVQDRPVPLLAVNLGGLGFLTEITREELPGVLEDVAAGRHQLEARRLLDVEIHRGSGRAGRYRALNDVVLHKAALARIVDFDVTIDGRFVSRFRADGLILATPTGSTAYSLAAGGPIMLPAVDAVVLTPIAPHMLTNRPLVIPGAARIEVRVEQPGQPIYVTVDGQVGEELRGDERVLVRRSEAALQLVRSPHRDYFQVLRSKLRWGER